jgi:hypothetical protein
MVNRSLVRSLAGGFFTVLALAAPACSGKVDIHKVQVACRDFARAAPALRSGKLPIPTSVQPSLLQAIGIAKDSRDHRLSSALDKIDNEILHPITDKSTAAIEAAAMDASRECAAQGFPIGSG